MLQFSILSSKSISIMSKSGPCDKNELQKMSARAAIPAVAVSTANGEKTSCTCTGVTDVQSKNPVNVNTVFEAASLSKPVFAYLILKLIEQGKFSRQGDSAERGLDRPLYELCKEFGPPHLRIHPNFENLTKHSY